VALIPPAALIAPIAPPKFNIVFPVVLEFPPISFFVSNNVLSAIDE
jgi:hypothetical protein